MTFLYHMIPTNNGVMVIDIVNILYTCSVILLAMCMIMPHYVHGKVYTTTYDFSTNRNTVMELTLKFRRNVESILVRHL